MSGPLDVIVNCFAETLAWIMTSATAETMSITGLETIPEPLRRSQSPFALRPVVSLSKGANMPREVRASIPQHERCLAGPSGFEKDS